MHDTVLSAALATFPPGVQRDARKRAREVIRRFMRLALVSSKDAASFLCDAVHGVDPELLTPLRICAVSVWEGQDAEDLSTMETCKLVELAGADVQRSKAWRGFVELLTDAYARGFTACGHGPNGEG